MPMDLVKVGIICDKVNDGAKYECGICRLDIEIDCVCIWDPEVTEIDVFCHAHQDWHRGISVEALVGHITNYDPETEPEYQAAPSTGTSSWKSSSTKATKSQPSISFTSKCRHFNNPVEFPDGTKVYPSSKHDRGFDDPSPDFGLYLDSSWNPSCLAFLVDWPDMHIPYKWDKAAEAIIETYKKAQDGFWVEIGCIGGHGRTGTALSCMAVLSGLTAKDAIEYVRKNYCTKAVESSEQEWWVEWFEVFMKGGTTSPQPVYSKGKWYVGDEYSYSEPFGWQEWDPSDDKQGGPPPTAIQSGLEQYFSVRYYDEKGSYQTKYVDQGTPEFVSLMAWTKEQEEAKAAAKAAEKAAKDAAKKATAAKKAPAKTTAKKAATSKKEKVKA